MTKRTIMEMAQEAGMVIHSFWAEQKLEAFAALVREEALAQPEQEPVAKVVLTETLGLPCLQWLDLNRQFDFKGGEYLYTTPLAAQPAYRAVKTYHEGKPWYVAQPAVAEPHKQESVTWKWQQAPVKTQWGHDMVVADLATDKDHTVSVYCERDQIAKVEVMFTPPAQPAPVQEPFCFVYVENGEEYFAPKGAYVPDNAQPLYTTPPNVATPLATQRTWVGLTNKEIYDCEPKTDWYDSVEFAQAIEAKLRSKNENL